MLVREGIVDLGNQGLSSQNLLTHLVHCVLDTGAVLGRKEAEGDLANLFPGLVELGHVLFDRIQRLKCGPGPAGVHRSAQNAVVCVLEDGIVVGDEAVELRASALKDEQFGNAGSDLDAFALVHIGLDHSLLGPVSEEGMRVGFAVDSQPGPSMLDDSNVCRVNVLVGVDEVSSEDGSKLLGRVDGVLLCNDVGGLFHGISCNDDRVVGLSVSGGC